MKYRFIGLLLLVAAGFMAYISLVQSLLEAQMGKPSILDGGKVIVLLPLSAIVGIGLVGGGESFFKMIGKEGGTKFTKLGYVIFVIGAGIGLSLAFWHSDILISLGYRRVW